MAFNLKRSAGELYNKGVIKAGELRDERQRKLGLKVSVVVEREDGKRLLINTHGVKGHVQIDDYDEEKIAKFLGHPLGGIRAALKTGKRYVDNKERITFDFSAPAKAPVKPFKPIVIKLPKAAKPSRSPVSKITTAKPQKAGYYSWTLGRWVN
jgi:phospholipase C